MAKRNLPDAEVDVDLDIRISCSAGKIRLDIENIVVKADWLWVFEKEGKLDSFSFTVDTGQPLCTPITVRDNGDVDLGTSALCRSRFVN